MLEKFEIGDKYLLVAGALSIAFIAFIAGAFLACDLTGTYTDDDAATKDKIKQNVQSYMDLRMKKNKNRFASMIENNEKISEEQISLKARVGNINTSKYGSLYKTTVTISGTIPWGERLSPVMRRRTFYLTPDGEVLVQAPTNLDNTA